MFKLCNILILGATLGLTAMAYADESQSPVVNHAVTAVAKDTKVANADKKTEKKAKKAKKAVIKAQLDMEAFNSATDGDIEKAVGKKAAARIAAAKTRLGGKFADTDQLGKEAKIGKRQMQKLAKAFPKAAEI
ncbi:MAG: hypothetical protein A2X78_00560 [Gammaproteobacteria bacterium GWE2_37_16]|nr:MAG: hypothetical protein A2X78_00560 [Gammaproteobacteria bacterium GWE2_37_16]